MTYALLDENNIVINLIVLTSDTAKDFPNAIYTNNVCVHIGDLYQNGYFYHEGERCYSVLEELQIALQILTLGVDIDE